MPKPKMIFLTSVSTEINEKGEERVNKAVAKSKKREDDEDVPEYGSDAWYKSIGVKPPLDLEDEEDEIDENGLIELDESEFEYIHNEVILERSDFSSAVDSLNGLTTVYTKGGLLFDVLENTDEIFGQIYLLDQTWLESFLEDLKWRVKRLFTKEKDLEL